MSKLKRMQLRKLFPTAGKPGGEQASQKRLLGRLRNRRGFGLNEVIGIAAGIIIAVVVVIPGLRGFAGDILANLNDWWNDMAASIFAGT